MGIVIYGHPISTCTKRVLVALEEKNVTDYKLETVDIMTGAQKQPAFLEKQPFGKVPVLEDGDVSIYESRALARYVCDKYEGQGEPLMGKNLKEKAAVNQWLEVESLSFNPPVAGLVFELVFKNMLGQTKDDAKVEQLTAEAKKILDIYEAHFAKTKNQFIAGDFISLADLSHLPYGALLWPAGKESLIMSRPNVAAWWERISSRPSWAKIGKAPQ